MSGDWIKLEVAISDKPEVWAMAAQLDIDPDAVVGKLVRVWSWFDQQTESGNAPSVTAALLDRKVGVSGFCESMKSAGWLVEEDGRIYLPNFDRHNGKTAKTRALTAKRVAAHKKKSNASANAHSVTSALPREEKRREEDKNGETIVSPPMSAEADLMGPQVLQVFAYWQAALKHPQSKLTKERRAKIAARLKEGYSVEDLKAAVDGCSRSPHHMGRNDTGTVYDDIELICRSGGYVEKFKRLPARRLDDQEMPHGPAAQNRNPSYSQRPPTGADNLAQFTSRLFRAKPGGAG